MAHTERHEPDLFAGILEKTLAAHTATTKTPGIKPPEEDEDDDVKADGAFKTISETAKMLALPQHVLRFWESKFTQIKPLKLKGGRRYYRPQDIEVLLAIKHLLYKQGYTIKGARKAFNQFKRQKDHVMAEANPKKNRKQQQPRINLEDTPLFGMLDTPGNAPQSALVHAALSNAAAGPLFDLKPMPKQEAKPALAAPKPVELKLEAAPKVPQNSVSPAQVIAAKAEAPAPKAEAVKVEAAPAVDTRQAARKKEELKDIYGELLELRELIKGLPALSTASV